MKLKTIEEVFKDRWQYKNVENAVVHTDKELNKWHKEEERRKKEEAKKK